MCRQRYSIVWVENFVGRRLWQKQWKLAPPGNNPLNKWCCMPRESMRLISNMHLLTRDYGIINTYCTERRFMYMYTVSAKAGVLGLIPGNYFSSQHRNFLESNCYMKIIPTWFHPVHLCIYAIEITVGACFLLQTIAVLCNRNAIELRRYGAPTWFPKTPKLVLVTALCGRGGCLFDVLVLIFLCCCV